MDLSKEVNSKGPVGHGLICPSASAQSKKLIIIIIIIVIVIIIISFRGLFSVFFVEPVLGFFRRAADMTLAESCKIMLSIVFHCIILYFYEKCDYIYRR